MSEKHDRLRQARMAAGYETAQDAAQLLKVSYTTYAGHENGSRGFNDVLARRYAEAFRVPLEWLAFGQGSGPRQRLGFAEGDGLPAASAAATDPRAGLAMPSGTNDMRVNIQGGQLIVNAAVDKKGVEALKKMIEAYEAMLE